MRVAYIELDGIGPFEKASFQIPPPPEGQLGELVLFEGPNGCGKSTIMEAITTAAAAAPETSIAGILLGDEDEFPGARPPRWLSRFRSLTGQVAMELEQAGQRVKLGLQQAGNRGVWGDSLTTPPPEGPVQAVLASLSLAVRFQAKGARWAAFSYRGRLSSASLAPTSTRSEDVWRAALTGALSFGDKSSLILSLGQFLKDQTYERLVASEAATLSSDEAERATSVATAKARRESIERLQAALTAVLDRKVSFVFPVGRLEPRVSFDGEELDPDVLGEGLRATFSWLSDLLMRLSLVNWEDRQRSPFEQEFWLILDEIDESMHPLMQARFFPELRKLFPNAHIYATTHSPFAVAACTDGWVFPIRPRADNHRVVGEQRHEPLEPGQSLEYVVEKVFNAPSTFVDEPTRNALATHLDGVKALRGGKALDLEAFREARAFLMKRNDEVQTIVAMREGQIRKLIEQRLSENTP